MKTLIVLTASVSAVAVASPAMAQKPEYVPGQYICQFDASVSPAQVRGKSDQAAAKVRGQVIHRYEKAIKGFAVRLPNENSMKNPASAMKSAGVAKCEQDQIATIGDFPTKKAPGGKGKPGSGTGGGQTTPSGITAVGGLTSYSGGKTAWVIDTGIDLDHEDLNVDVARSRNFVARDSSPEDINGHGSHVAGTIAALNNSVGVIGVAPGAKVVAVRVLDRRGSGTYSAIIDGVDYVAQNGGSGDVANMSLGGGYSQALNDAVVAAAATGVKFALAAGNESTDANTKSPASANGNNIYTISAMTSTGNWASFSNYGNPPVDYAEPGVSVLSTYKNGGYSTLSARRWRLRTWRASSLRLMARRRPRGRSTVTRTAIRIRSASSSKGVSNQVTKGGAGRRRPFHLGKAAPSRSPMTNRTNSNSSRGKKPQGLPTSKQILEYIESSDQPAGKREIAKAFGLTGQDKIALKRILQDMADEGLIDSGKGRAFHKMGGIPRVTVLKVVSIDDGEVWAQPEQWHADTPPPKLRVIERGRRSSLAVHDRILSRTEEAGQGHVAHVMKKLARSAEMLMGVVRKEGSRHFLAPIDKKVRTVFQLTDLGEAEVGDLVLAEPIKQGRQNAAKVDAVLGDPFAPKAFSLIAIHKYGIRDRFPEDVIAEAEKVSKQPLGDHREDLTHLPIVAIDPVDARDHDDAIWAAHDDADDNPGGYKAVVAIADVSFYVRPDSKLDREARKRGNSVYFPDRVVPMLPEELSADICSLKEGVDRAAMACHLRFDSGGNIKDFRFTRAKVRIAANIAYEDAQAAIDGDKDRVDPGLVAQSLRPLWDCWKVMFAGREARQPLELDLPERRVELDEKGRIMSVAPRERLDAHRLVEDYMIAANVAAAKALERKKSPVMYRIHETPDREKLVSLKDYLKTFDIEFSLGQVIKPQTFNRVIERIGEDHDNRHEIMIQILRSQMQARYGPEPLGHFGLALGSYAHFTSPIRRYADLVVHRSLVSAFKLGEGGLSKETAADSGALGELISGLERRAMEAERDTVDRYVAAFLADRVGQLVKARITGVQPFGFFATVEDLGGDGLVLAKSLGREYFRYDEKRQSLVGDKSGDEYRAGQRLELKLVEADPVSGALRFELPEGSYGGDSQDRRDGSRTGQGRRDTSERRSGSRKRHRDGGGRRKNGQAKVRKPKKPGKK